MRLQRIESPTAEDWARLERFEDRLVYQTPEWLSFIARAQGAEPVLAEVREGEEVAGYFTGLVAKRFGIPILGSPMPGWTTAFMGFNLEPGASRRAATEALLDFGFGPLGCMHLELRDRHLGAEEVAGLGMEITPWHGLELDMTGTIDEVFMSVKGPTRTAIRKAEKGGVTVEEAGADGFAEEFHAQLTDVFAKQSLVPPYGPGRIRELVEEVHPGGRLLLLRARNSAGDSIATGIFPGTGGWMHFLAGASWREHQALRPNEALMWEAVRRWHERGVKACDLGGFMDYKRKWNPIEVRPPFLRRSRNPAIARLRNLAEQAVGLRTRTLGRLRS